MEKLVYSGDLELVVSAANQAGYMESNGSIYVDDDTELTEFILEILYEYGELPEENTQSFVDYACDRLMEEYGTDVATH